MFPLRMYLFMLVYETNKCKYFINKNHNYMCQCIFYNKQIKIISENSEKLFMFKYNNMYKYSITNKHINSVCSQMRAKKIELTFRPLYTNCQIVIEQ